MQSLESGLRESDTPSENGLDLLVQQLFSLAEEVPSRENFRYGEFEDSNSSWREHQMYKTLVDGSLKEVCADFFSLLWLIRKSTLEAVNSKPRRGGRVTEELADLQESLHRQFNSTAQEYIERLTLQPSGEGVHPAMLGKRVQSDANEGLQDYAAKRNPDFMQLKGPGFYEPTSGLAFKQPGMMKVANHSPKVAESQESAARLAEDFAKLSKEAQKSLNLQSQPSQKKDIFVVRRPISGVTLAIRPTGKRDESRPTNSPQAPKTRIGSNSRSEARVTRSKSSKSGGDATKYSPSQLAFRGRGKNEPPRRGGSVDTAGARANSSRDRRVRNSDSRGRELSSRETSQEITGKSTLGSSHIRGLSSKSSAGASGNSTNQRIGRLERKGDTLVRKINDQDRQVSSQSSSEQPSDDEQGVATNANGIGWAEKEKLRKDRRNERDWIKRQAKLGIKIDPSSVMFTHTIFEKETCKLYCQPGEKSFTFFGKYDPQPMVERVTQQASNQNLGLEERIKKPASKIMQEEHPKMDFEASVRDESESGTKSGTSLGKRELKAPKPATHKKGANRNSFLDQDEQTLLQDSQVMRDNLELVDHGDYFPMAKPALVGESEDMIFRVDKISATDFVICRQEYSVLYRKQQGVPPVSLPHPKEQLLNFKAYKETTWILVTRKVPSVATLGLKIIDMAQLDKKLPRFVLEEVLIGPTILLHGNHLFAIKQQGVFAYNLEELNALLKTDNARSYVPKLVYGVKKATDCCIEGQGLFIVCDHSNILHRVDLTGFATFAKEALTKLPSKCSPLLSDDVINENYITNTRIKSLEGDVLACTTSKLVLISEEGISQDQYSSKNMIDMCIFKHKQDKFVLAVHRREDVSLLRIYNGGFFVIMRLLSLETDKSLYQGILHLNDFEFLVYGDKGYCKHFELKFDTKA